MINFEKMDSIFFRNNRSYCESIEEQLSKIGFTSSGYCNAFGFHLTSKGKLGEMTCELTLSKSQSTQNGVVIPVNSREAISFEVQLQEFPSDLDMSITRSMLRRFFNLKSSKSALPSPYSLSCNRVPAVATTLLQFLNDYAVDIIKLRDGKLYSKMRISPRNPLQLMQKIDEVIKNW